MPPRISGWVRGRQFKLTHQDSMEDQAPAGAGQDIGGRHCVRIYVALARQARAVLNLRALAAPQRRKALLVSLSAIVIGAALMGGLYGVTLSTGVTPDDTPPASSSVESAVAPETSADILADQEPSVPSNDSVVSISPDSGSSASGSQEPPSSGGQVTLPPEPSTSGPSIVVPTATVEVGATVEVTLTMPGASYGVSGFDIVVTVEDGAVAEIVDVAYPDFGLSDTRDMAADHVRVRAVDLLDIARGDSDVVELVTLTILGKQAGTSQLSVAVNAIDDDFGEPIVPDIHVGEIQAY